MAVEKKLEAPEEVVKPSYEELKNWCDQLMVQRNQLSQKLQQVTSVVNKLPWLFEVVNHREAFPSEFVDMCIKEIEMIMTPPQEESEEESEENKE